MVSLLCDSVEDDPCSGLPLTAYSENDIISMKGTVHNDARLTVEEIADISGLGLWQFLAF